MAEDRGGIGERAYLVDACLLGIAECKNQHDGLCPPSSMAKGVGRMFYAEEGVIEKQKERGR